MSERQTHRNNSFLARVKADLARRKSPAVAYRMVENDYNAYGPEGGLAEALLMYPQTERAFMELHLRDGLPIKEAKAAVGYRFEETFLGKFQQAFQVADADVKARKAAGEQIEIDRHAFPVPYGFGRRRYVGRNHGRVTI